MSKPAEFVRRLDDSSPRRQDKQMRYMVLVKMAEDLGTAPPALVEAMGAEMSRAFADGSMIAAGGLGGSDQTVEIQLRGGTITSSDGPFAEAKELVGGFSIVEARSRAEAAEGARRVIELHAEHWPGWEGAVEVRPIFGPEDGPPPAS